MKLFSIFIAACLIGMLMSGVVLMPEPVEAQAAEIVMGIIAIAALLGTGIFFIMLIVMPCIFFIISLFLIPILLSLVIGAICLVIGAIIGGILMLSSPLLILAAALAIITLPLWGIPFIFFLLSVGIFGFVISVAVGIFGIITFGISIMLAIMLAMLAIPILLIGALILQIVFGIPVFSILLSLLQMGGQLILTPLSLLKPLISGISKFIPSLMGSFSKIGKVETSEVIA
jgi:hypothetical protein